MRTALEQVHVTQKAIPMAGRVVQTFCEPIAPPCPFSRPRRPLKSFFLVCGQECWSHAIVEGGAAAPQLFLTWRRVRQRLVSSSTLGSTPARVPAQPRRCQPASCDGNRSANSKLTRPDFMHLRLTPVAGAGRAADAQAEASVQTPSCAKQRVMLEHKPTWPRIHAPRWCLAANKMLPGSSPTRNDAHKVVLRNQRPTSDQFADSMLADVAQRWKLQRVCVLRISISCVLFCQSRRGEANGGFSGAGGGLFLPDRTPLGLDLISGCKSE